MILPPRSLAMGPAAHGPYCSGYGVPLPSYPTPTFDFAVAAPSIGDAAAVDRFFEGPRVDDPVCLAAFARPHGADGVARPPPPTRPVGGRASGERRLRPVRPAHRAPLSIPTAPPTGPPLALAGATTPPGDPGPNAAGLLDTHVRTPRPRIVVARRRCRPLRHLSVSRVED